MRTNRSAAVVAASFLLSAGAAITAMPAAHAAAPAGTHAVERNADFNGDGYEDVLTGAPRGTVNGHKGAGFVTVQYGSSRGMGTTRRAVLHQDTAGVPGATEAGDAFGKSVASGDLDNDGYDDAIVAAPNEDLGTVADAGGLVIFWGTPNGLSGAESQWLEADSPTAGQAFGTALAAARFCGNMGPGDQLAVTERSDVLSLYGFEPAAPAAARTTPETNHRKVTADSSVRLSRGTGTGPSAMADYREISPKALTAGNFRNDGFADLVSSGVDAEGHGWSHYFIGGYDHFDYERDLPSGPVATSGDIDGDGYDDLVTGEPHSPGDSGATMTGGTIAVYYGSPTGPVGEGGEDNPRLLTQDTAGVPGVAEQGDGWGTDLSLGDANGDGFADLAVGAAGEDIGSVADAGAVWVLRGSANGLTTSGALDINQNTANVPGGAERNDHFGGQVRLTDPNADGRYGLLAAAPQENTDDGVVWVFSAGSGGITTTGSWTYGAGALGAPAADAWFGAAIDE